MRHIVPFPWRAFCALIQCSLLVVCFVAVSACADIGSSYPDVGSSSAGTSEEEINNPPVDVPDEPPQDAVEDDTGSDPDEGATTSDEDIPVDEDITEPKDSSDDTEDVLDVSDEDVPNCDDKNPCTQDLWNGEECLHDYEYDVCYTANPMCDDDDPCTDDICLEGFCTHEPSCCTDDAECNDYDDLCTVDSCVVGNCVLQSTQADGCCEMEFFEHAFDDESLGGVTLDNSDPEVGWHVVSDSLSKSPPGSLRYGSLVVGNYDNGLSHSGTLSLPPIALSPAVESWITFDLFLDVEYGTYSDTLEVHLTEEGGSQNLVIWNKAKAYVYNGWWSHKLQLTAFAGKTVSITFVFDTVDEEDNDGQGVFLDNLHVYSNCQPRLCSFDSDCDDGLGVTSDICANGVCIYKPNSKYCTSYKDCDDAEPCTSNICSQNACIYPEISSCCLSNSDCDDGALCTLDDCVGAYAGHGGYCQHIAITDCCLTSVTCSDGNPCTVDSCPVPGQPCAHVSIANCCTVHEDCDDGDPCSENLCVSGACQQNAVCCTEDADCSDNDLLCTDESCLDGICSVEFVDKIGCCKKGLIFKNFPSGSLQGFQLESDSNFADGVAWMGVISPALSTPGALHYGSANGTYATGQPNSATIVSNAFKLPSTTITRLSFWLYLDNEYSNGVGSKEWDHLTISAYRVDKPSDELVLWDSAGGEPAWWLEEEGKQVGPKWTQVENLDLTPFKGRTVRLRFAFDTLDEDANDYMGVYLDDIKVITTCGP
ncbi:MAG TPA: hypothetical protein EYN66_12515 [Myxococcales bacterium]|nr:hypothetical protein [Myxococcales bacterium]